MAEITPTTSSVTSAAATSLLNSLDAGSGVDTTSLVTSLVQAQFAARTAALTAKYDKLTSQISGVSTLKSAITDFTKALETLVKSGSLSAQPISSNTNVLTASALSGAKLSGMTANVTVSQLAAAQTAVSTTAVATKDTAIGTGTFTLQLGTASYDSGGAMTAFAAGATAAVTIDVTAANNSLTGLAAAINAKKAGVTASVVTDADGTAYLSLKGATGAAQAFTLEATTDDDGTLAAYNVGPTANANMTITTQAKNAKLTVDGVAVERASNSISDLIAGVKLDLTATSTIPVALSASTPTASLSSAVNDLVATYNDVLALVREQTDPITGPLRGDTAARTMERSLKALTLKPLVTNPAPNTPSTLAEIGVATNRDGTLRVDPDRLAAALAANPDAIEAMFAPPGSGATGIYAALASVQLAATSTLYGLGASATRYNAAQGEIDEAKDKITDQSATMNTRLTKQFSSMNARVAAYKSTQTFLENQIKAWNNSDN